MRNWDFGTQGNGDIPYLGWKDAYGKLASLDPEMLKYLVSIPHTKGFIFPSLDRETESFPSPNWNVFLWKLAWAPPLWGVNWQQVDEERKRVVPTHSCTAGSKPVPSPPPPPVPISKSPLFVYLGKREIGEKATGSPPSGTLYGSPTPGKSPERDQPGSSLVAQQVRDLALSLQQLGSRLWHWFDPWPGNFHMPQTWPKHRDQPGQRKAEFEAILSCFLSNTLKDVFPLHTLQHVEEGAGILRPGQWWGRKASHPSLCALRTTLYFWPPHQSVSSWFPLPGGRGLQRGRYRRLPPAPLLLSPPSKAG